jgi:hypothetical protein
MEYTEFPPAAEQPDHRLEPKDCLRNSLNMAVEDTGLLYAEGIAKGYAGLWYRHAWNVNEAGEAVDYTWVHTGMRYIGSVVDTFDKVAAVVRMYEYHFERNLTPYVPEGEIGLDCYTEEQANWVRDQLSRRSK